MDDNDFDQSAQLTGDQLLNAARCGDVEAMFELGEAFRIGDPMARDYAEALTWFRRAAEEGHPGAQNNLGSMFQNGMGTPVDSVEAALWYQLAAQQGHPVAQFNLAMRYLKGDGLPLAVETAVQWLRKASEQGYIEAIGQLGTLLRFGQGVERDIVSAAKLHIIAASENDVNSMGNLMGYQNDIENAALAGSVLAAVCLAKIHARGITVPKNKIRAWAWLQWAKSHGTKDNDADVQKELLDWISSEEMLISKDVQQQTEELLLQMEKRAADATTYVS